MKERYLARGCAALDIHEAISYRLYLPGSDQGILEPEFVQTPPGLFFSQGQSLNIVRTRQEYAVDEAKKASKIPCVITMRIDEANFRNLHKRVWNARVTLDNFGRLRSVYDAVENLKGFSGRVVAVALDKMSDADLVAVETRVGFLLPEWKRFKYQYYEEYLKNPQFKNPTTPEDYENWLKGLE